MRQFGERVVIDGPRLSACTLVLSTIPGNRSASRGGERLASMPAIVRSRTGYMARAPEANRAVTASDPGGLRSWIKRRGGRRIRSSIFAVRSLWGLIRTVSNLAGVTSFVAHVTHPRFRLWSRSICDPARTHRSA